jgi:small-conductance mechanosensitive channel
VRELLLGLQGGWPWALGLVVGFPLALVVLNEAALSLSRRSHPLAESARFFRNWVAPLVALGLFLRHVALLPADGVAVRVAATLAWFAAVVGAIGLVNNAVFEAAEAGSWRQRVPRLLRDLLRVMLVAVGAAFVYSIVWGRELSGALAALGVTSIVVGLALQQPLGNLFSGVVLLIERPFEVGDSIEVGSVWGVVQEINWRSVHILQPVSGHMEVVPNSTLNQETIRNFSRPRPLRMGVVEIGFSYNDPPDKVKDALLELARETEGVLAEPPPVAATAGYGDFAVNYKLLYRTTEEDRWAVRNRLLTRLWYVAKRNGFTIPFPIRVNIDHPPAAPYAPAEPAPGDLLARFPRIPRVPHAEAAGAMRRLRFSRDETVFREGQTLEGVYLLVSGSVSLHVGEGGQSGEIATVRPGEFFGEVGMYGRQPAEVGAVALEDTEVLLIAPEAVRQLFEASPRLARETGEALDVRRKATKTARGAPRG